MVLTINPDQLYFFQRLGKPEGLPGLSIDVRADDFKGDARKLIERTALALEKGLIGDTIHQYPIGKPLFSTPDEIELGSVMPDTERLDARALYRCMSQLEPRGRAVLHLSFQEERSPDEIASALGTTTANVRVLRHRAVAQVRACLDSKEAAA